jgi:hypothetical protein
MLLQYHDYLLKESIPKNYFQKINDTYINLNLLTEGLHHPDVPCSNLIVSNNNQIKYLNYKTCKIPLSLIYLFDENNNGLEEIVQSHRGRQAIGHSMTYDSEISMIELRQKILRRLEISYMLALEDNSILEKCANKNCEVCYNTWFSNYSCSTKKPNIFWLGQILHCIQDSYSRAHTLRKYEKDFKYHLINKNIVIKNIFSKSDKEKQLDTFKLIKKIGDIIDKINLNKFAIPNNILDFLKKYIKNEKLIKIIKANPNDISHIFKVILFFKYQEKQIADLYNGRYNVPSYKNVDNNTSPIKNYPYIVSFRYIADQSECGMFFHAKYDVQKTNKEFEKYIIKNCKEILKMYKRHIFDNKTSIQEKIKEFTNYIAINVFPIPKEYHNKSSASATNCEL